MATSQEVSKFQLYSPLIVIGVLVILFMSLASTAITFKKHPNNSEDLIPANSILWYVFFAGAIYLTFKNFGYWYYMALCFLIPLYFSM